MRLKDRLERVTRRMTPPEIDRTQIEEDAAWVTKKLNDYANNLHASAATMTSDDRSATGFSQAMHVAWHMRFEPLSIEPASHASEV